MRGLKVRYLFVIFCCNSTRWFAIDVCTCVIHRIETCLSFLSPECRYEKVIEKWIRRMWKELIISQNKYVYIRVCVCANNVEILIIFDWFPKIFIIFLFEKRKKEKLFSCSCKWSSLSVIIYFTFFTSFSTLMRGNTIESSKFSSRLMTFDNESTL